MRHAARLALVVGVLALSACQVPAPRPGRAQASADTVFVLPLGGRALVLDGFGGAIDLRTDTAATVATVRLTRTARGATRASARGRLARVNVHTAADGEMLQVVWRTSLAAGADAVARVTLPPRAVVVARLGTGAVAARGIDGGLDADVDSGRVTLHAERLRGVRARVRTGAVTVVAPRAPRGARWRVSVGTGAARLVAARTASLDLTAVARDGRVGGAEGLPRAVRDGRPPSERVRAQLGAGEAMLHLESGRGPVVLHVVDGRPAAGRSAAGRPAAR